MSEKASINPGKLKIRGKFSLLSNFPRILSLPGLILALSLITYSQNHGSLKGVVQTSAGTPAPGVSVVAINQVTSRTRRILTSQNGQFSLNLPAGAYHIS